MYDIGLGIITLLWLLMVGFQLNLEVVTIGNLLTTSAIGFLVALGWTAADICMSKKE